MQTRIHERCAADAAGSHRAAPRIVEGGLHDDRVIALLAVHLARSRSETAAGSAHAFDVSALRAPDIRFWSAWSDETLLGCGALRRLTTQEGEVKSMHTAEAARRTGVARSLLATIIAAPARPGCCG